VSEAIGRDRLTRGDRHLPLRDMAWTMRAAALRGVRPLVDSLGGDGAELLARFGIRFDAVDTHDAVVRAVAVARVLEHAAREFSCPDFGLRLAAQQDVSILGTLAVAIENSSTIGDAVACTSRFLFVHSPALSLSEIADPEGRPGVVGLRYGIGERGQASPQGTDLGLGLAHRILLLLSGGTYGLRSVLLPHPPLARLACYTEFFGADVRFCQPAAVLRIPRSLLAQPTDGGNEVLRALAVNYLETHFPRPARSVAARVQDALIRSLGSSTPRIDAVASAMQMHPRTLQRYLAAEHTTFAAVVDDARRHTAYQLLTESDIPLSRVAGVLGFASQSTLTRASRRWFGVSPSEIRRRGRDGGDSGIDVTTGHPSSLTEAGGTGIGPGPAS